MKFAIITDLHHGPEGSGIKDGIQRKMVAETPQQIKKIVEKINAVEGVEFIVNLGDVIEDVNDEAIDLQYFAEAQGLLEGFEKPLYTLIGNHDQRTLTHENLRKILGYDSLYYSFVSKGIKFIALHAIMLGDHTVTLSDIRAGIDETQLNWLRDELKEDLPTIVFSHYSAADMNLANNFWFEGNEECALLFNRKEVRDILEERGNVIAFINGHVHWNNITIHNNIPYVTQQSVSENFTNEGVPAGTYSIIEIKDNVFDMMMYGNDRNHVKFDF